jgi:hypothetical protein
VLGLCGGANGPRHPRRDSGTRRERCAALVRARAGSAVGLPHTWGRPAYPPQRLARRPGLRRPWLPPVRPLLKPTAHPEGARPPTVDRFEEPRRPVRRDRDGGLEPPFAQLPSPRQPTLLALALAGREAQAHRASLHADTPDTPAARLTAPPPSGFIPVAIQSYATS